MESNAIRRIAIDQIDEFVPNPRRRPNPVFERLKDSIRRVGIIQPLVLVRRGKRYGLAFGGHSRLRAFTELWAETKDEQFCCVPAVIRPDCPDIDLMAAHIVENNVRSGLTFIEKALIIEQFVDRVDWTGPITQRELVEDLKKFGLPVSQSELTLLEYAALRLLPLMPRALFAGLGRTTIQRLRRLDLCLEQLWVQWGLGAAADYDALFCKLARQDDRADWNDLELRAALESVLSERSEKPLGEVQKVISNALGERVVTASSVTTAKTSQCSATSTTPVSEVDNVTRLRALAFASALKLASAYGFDEAVVPTADSGIGYLLIDTPCPEVAKLLTPSQSARVAATWWVLAGFCDLGFEQPRQWESWQRTPVACAIASRGRAGLAALVPAPDLALMGRDFFAVLDAGLWSAYLTLARCYRDLQNLEPDPAAEKTP